MEKRRRNFTFAAWFPWFLELRSSFILLCHVIFGALAGGLYELLEVERFVPVDAAPATPASPAGERP